MGRGRGTGYETSSWWCVLSYVNEIIMIIILFIEGLLHPRHCAVHLIYIFLIYSSLQPCHN